MPSLASTAIVFGHLFAVKWAWPAKSYWVIVLCKNAIARVSQFWDNWNMQKYTLQKNLILTIREAEPRDAEQMLVFVEQVAGESENTGRGPGEFTMTVEQEREFLQESLDSPIKLFLVAEIDGEIVGNMSFQAGPRLRVRHIGEMGISVLRKYWGLGIGGLLLANLIEWARGTGIIRKIDLRVRIDNLPAIHLYEKYGFIHEGRITRGFYLHGKFVDLYIMGLPIDPPETEE